MNLKKKADFFLTGKLGMVLLVLFGLVVALFIIGIIGSKMHTLGQTSFRMW